MQSYRELMYEVDARVARIVLDRPKKLNAVTQLLYEELRHAFMRADTDPAVDVVILTGAGRAFCSGGDLTEVNEMHQEGRELDLALVGVNSSATFRQMEAMEKPIVALVNGLAHAAGLILVLQSDIAIASEKARFRLPEALRGMAEPYAAAHLGAHIGFGRAKYMILTCAEIDAARAEAWGLVSRVVPHEELEAAGKEVVAQILETQPTARRWNKALMNRTLPPFDGQALRATIQSAETMDGTQSFRK